MAARIEKRIREGHAAPNLSDYEGARPSMDILRWVQGIHEALGVEIPEEDYGNIATLGKAVDYVSARL